MSWAIKQLYLLFFTQEILEISSAPGIIMIAINETENLMVAHYFRKRPFGLMSITTDFKKGR